jgi:lipoprotein NlpI
MRSQILAQRNDKARGDLATAIADLGQLLKRFPHSPELRLQRGLMLNRAHRFEEAIVDLTAVLADRPSSAAAAIERGTAQIELDQVDAARADFDSAVKFEPEVPAVFVARGQFLARLGEEEAALADYDRAIKIFPREADAYSGRGHVLLQQGDVDTALESFDRAVRFDDQAAYLLSGRGSAYQVDGNYAAAIKDYRRAIELDTAEPFTHLLLYVAQRRSGAEAAEAEADLRSFADNARYDDWPRTIARFFLGEIDAPALERAADQGSPYDHENQAFDRDFYLGQAARQYLEFNIAAAEIGALGKLDTTDHIADVPTGEVSTTTHKPNPAKKNEK